MAFVISSAVSCICSSKAPFFSVVLFCAASFAAICSLISTFLFFMYSASFWSALSSSAEVFDAAEADALIIVNTSGISTSRANMTATRIVSLLLLFLLISAASHHTFRYFLMVMALPPTPTIKPVAPNTTATYCQMSLKGTMVMS